MTNVTVYRMYHILMEKRIFLIHGWGGSPEKDWFPWFVRMTRDPRPATRDSYECLVPSMPDTDHPVIESWVNHLKQLVRTLRPTDIFVGHSIGCQTILRYLEKLPEGHKADKVILVAPWLTLTNLENEEAWNIARPWLHTLIDLRRVPEKANSYTLLFSDNDPFVPLEENKRLFEKWIHPNIKVFHNRGHFTAEDGVTEMPELIKLL